MSIATLSVDLLLNIGQYTRNAAQATQASNRMVAGINSSLNQLKGVAAGLAGALSVDFLLGATKGAFDYADAIVDLSNQTGAATKTIQEFRYAAQLSGSSVENADAALGKFTKNMGESLRGGKAQQQMFKDLGVTSDDYDIALTQTIAGIGKLKSTQEQAAATAQIFGKSAADLVPLMASGKAGYDGLAAAAQSLGVVLEDQVLQNAGLVNDKIDQMTMIVTAQFANTIIQNADAFASLASSMMSAAGAASQFFASMANSGNIDILNSPNLTNFASWVRGSNGDATRAGATKSLMGNKEGRTMLYTRNVDRQNALRARLNGRVPGAMNDPAADRAELVRLETERKAIVTAHARARLPAPARPPVATGGGMPTGALATKPKPEKKAAAPKISDYEKELSALRFEGEQLGRNSLQRETYNALKSAGVKLDTEEGRVIAGLVVANDNLSKSRDLTEYFRDQQHEIEQLGRSAREQAIYNQAHAMGIDIQSQLGRTLATNVGHYYDLRAAKEAADSKAKDADTFNIAKSDEYYAKQDALLQQRKDFASNLGEIGRAGFEDWMTGVSNFGDALKGTLKDVSNTFLSDFLNGTLKMIAGKLSEVFAGVGGGGGGILGKILGFGSNLLAGSLGGPTGLSAGLTGVTSIGSTDAAATLASIPSISLSGARQAGGAVNDNGAYLVGEKGPEIFTPSSAGAITSNARLRGNFGGGGNMTINSTVTGVNDPAMVRSLAGQTIAQATPAMLRMSSDSTMSRSRRPRLS